MTQAELIRAVQEQLIGALTQVQQDASREVPLLTDESVPLRDLAGFDSLSGVETAVLLSERVGFDIDDLPFATAGGERPLTVREIVEAVVRRHGAALAAWAARGSGRSTTAVGTPSTAAPPAESEVRS